MNISTLTPATANIAPMCTVPPWLGGNCPMHDDAPFKILPIPGPGDDENLVPLPGPSDDPDSPLVPLPGPVRDARAAAGAIKMPIASSWG